ncbi:MAG: pyruvate kinase [Gemmatimonadota bacterium]|nr:pyruvate kinase [Gemmatimonadota bacterium]
MRRYRNAKIIATLGPASAAPETIRSLFESGADVFRLNLSHGSHDDHRARVHAIRELERDTYRPIGILIDLQGPKLRIGAFTNGVIDLARGDRFLLDSDATLGDATRVQVPHPEIFAALRADAELLLDDGKVRLRVIHGKRDSAETEVVVGGRLSDHKGISVPGTVVPLSPITDKDRIDLELALELGADWIALSFVQRPEDLDALRDLMGDRAKIMAKLEKPAAIEQLNGIIERADAIMVARGDLGVEMPPEEVPTVQKQVVRACRKAGKPVVVATQMLESMVRSPRPTRAEASDVATAIYDGADAVMLSAETAIGDYPLEAITMMNSIIRYVERDPHHRELIDAARPKPEPTNADAICSSLRTVTQILPVATTVTYTSSGYTSLRAARERPESPILSLTYSHEVARMLCLVWGVHSMVTERLELVSDVVENAITAALENDFAQAGQPLVITAGMPFGRSGTTNFLRIAWID